MQVSDGSLIEQAESLLQEERNFITNASNISALLFNALQDLNWLGFYFFTGKDLLLGPFQGKPACTRISLDRGVCGAAASKRSTLIVDDVHQFPGHIACDLASNSEIVVPMLADDRLVGVLDVDSPIFSRFTDEDRIFFESIVGLLINYSDADSLMNFYYEHNT